MAEINPFLGNINKKKLNIQGTGFITVTEDGSSIVSHETGETTAFRKFVATKQVDRAGFVRVYSTSISALMNLSHPATKTLFFVMHELQQPQNKDETLILLDKIKHQRFVLNYKIEKYSTRSMYMGINELIEANILKKTKNQGYYWVNPEIVFDGSRIKLITDININ